MAGNFSLGTIGLTVTANASQFNRQMQQMQQVVASTMTGVANNVNNATQSINKFSTSSMQKGFAQLSKVSTSSARETTAAWRDASVRMDAVGKSLVNSVTRPLVDFSRVAVDLGNAFELQMARIQGLVGIAKEQVDEWSASMRGLSEQTGRPMQDLAEGMYFVTSSGQRGKQAMDVLTESARAATAGLGTTKTVADAVTSAVNAYGKENLSAARATDILTAAVREGKFEASGMAIVVGRVLPLAKAMGVDFAEVAGAMAAMTKVGATIQQSGVQLTAIFSGLLRPTKEAKGVLAEHGMSAQQLLGMLRQPGGLMKTLRFMDTQFGGNKELFSEVFSDLRELRGVMNLLSQDGKEVDGVFSGVRKSVGDSGRAFDAVAKTNAFRFMQSMNAVKTMVTETGLAIAATLAPAMETLTRVVRSVSAWFAGLDESTKKSIVSFGVFAASIGPILLGLSAFIKLGLTLQALTKSIAAANAAMTAFRFTMVALPVATLVTGILYIASSFYGARDAADALNAATRDAIVLQEKLVKVQEAQENKRLKQVTDIKDPRERAKAAQKAVSQMEQNLSGKPGNLEKAQKELEEATSFIPDWVPFVGTKEVREAAQSKVDGIRKSIESLTSDIEKMKAVLEGAKAESKGFVEQWQDSGIKGTINDALEKMKEAVETAGMSKGEKTVYDIMHLKPPVGTPGASSSQLSNIEAWAKYSDFIDKQTQLKKKAESMLQQHGTPREQFEIDVKNLDEMLKTGAVTVEQYARMYAKLQAEMAGANKELHKFDQAASDSNEALARLADWRDKMNAPRPDLERARRRQEELAAEIPRKPVDIRLPEAITKNVPSSFNQAVDMALSGAGMFAPLKKAWDEQKQIDKMNMDAAQFVPKVKEPTETQWNEAIKEVQTEEWAKRRQKFRDFMGNVFNPFGIFGTSTETGVGTGTLSAPGGGNEVASAGNILDVLKNIAKSNEEMAKQGKNNDIGFADIA